MVVKDLVLPWDYFFHGEEAKGMSNHMDTFRRTIWPQIRRDLLEERTVKDGEAVVWRVPDGLEPHWIEPGKAMLWHQQTVREIVGTGQERKWEETASDEWSPTPVPIGNASQLAHYLKKGFRLRPPSDGVDAMYESAGPPEVQASPEPEEAKFWCRRHSKGAVGFPAWKPYISHCRMNNEPPDETPPDEIVEKASQFVFYCMVHDYGTNNKRLADQHRKDEQRRPSRRTHIPTEEMRIRKDEQ